MSTATDMPHLVVIETQKVKSYVFASSAMREIRGASLLLDRINRIEIEKILRTYTQDMSRKIYLGGGNGRVLFSDGKKADDFCKAIEILCRKKTVNARVVGQVVSRDGDESFSKWLSRGLEKARQLKTGRRQAIAQVAGRWIQPCSSCGVSPAERMYSEHGEHRLCKACYCKRQEVNKLYIKVKPTERRTNEIRSADELSRTYSEAFIFTTLARMREAQQDGMGTLLPQDFEDVGELSSPKNYMAFIYADGNAMGDTLRSFKDLYKKNQEAIQAQQAFSDIVDRACREAAVEAVLKHVPQPEKPVKNGMDRFIPAEFIMAGGDDLMLVVPSHCALDITADFLDKYQEKTRQLQHEFVAAKQLSKAFAPCGLTASAGVVVAHTHYPVRHLMELAAELMKIAKHQAAQQPKEAPCGTLDFMVISDAGSSYAKERRKTEYRGESNCRLTARPYTTGQARWLINTIRNLKTANVPRGKLKKLYSVLFQSPMQAQFDGLHIRERLRATGELQPGKPLATLFETLPYFPFQRGKTAESWQTPLTELVEFFDYIHPK